MRYQTAYPHINKQFFFDQQMSCGPIVEQGTHFVDLARFFCGECDIETLQTNAVYFGEKNLKMLHEEVDLSKIKKGNVNQIITSANYRSVGAVVSLTHGIHLYGKRYETYIDLCADGLSMNLSNPYDDKCVLRVRDGRKCKWKSERDRECEEMIYEFDLNESEQNDPYWMQMKCFLESINGQCNDNPSIQSDYNDAAYTYILSRDIQASVMAKSATSL